MKLKKRGEEEDDVGVRIERLLGAGSHGWAATGPNLGRCAGAYQAPLFILKCLVKFVQLALCDFKRNEILVSTGNYSFE